MPKTNKKRGDDHLPTKPASVLKMHPDSDASIAKEQLLRAYREMLYYRRFEEKVLQAYTQQKFAGFCHLHIGQEALCVGVQHSLRPTDYMISGYRSHTQAIAKGIPGKEVFAELLGKVTGCSRGKGGSMHMFSKEHRFLGGHGIVGGQVPLAVGVGFKIKYDNEDDVMVCYLGDAATNQGQFFEALNMAATWTLPVLFIVENNRYGMGTDIRRTTSVEHLYERALGVAMDHSQVDGMVYTTVYSHVKNIVNKMRKDKRPHFLEALTYRYKGHSVSDPGSYRSKEEVLKEQERDPILSLGKHLMNVGVADDKQLSAWDIEVKKQVKEDEAFADNSPQPDISEAFMHVFTE